MNQSQVLQVLCQGHHKQCCEFSLLLPCRVRTWIWLSRKAESRDWVWACLRYILVSSSKLSFYAAANGFKHAQSIQYTCSGEWWMIGMSWIRIASSSQKLKQIIHNCLTVAYPADLSTWRKTQNEVGEREREGEMLLLREINYGEEIIVTETTTF